MWFVYCAIAWRVYTLQPLSPRTFSCTVSTRLSPESARVWSARLGFIQCVKAMCYGSRQVHFFLAFLHTILSATVGACRRAVGACRRLSATVGELSAPVGELSATVGACRRLSAPVGELSAPDTANSCGRLSINYCEKGRQGPGL